MSTRTLNHSNPDLCIKIRDAESPAFNDCALEIIEHETDRGKIVRGLTSESVIHLRTMLALERIAESMDVLVGIDESMFTSESPEVTSPCIPPPGKPDDMRRQWKLIKNPSSPTKRT